MPLACFSRPVRRLAFAGRPSVSTPFPACIICSSLSRRALMVVFSARRREMSSTPRDNGTGGTLRPWKSHATPREEQFEQGHSRLHLSFFLRQDPQETGSWRGRCSPSDDIHGISWSSASKAGLLLGVVESRILHLVRGKADRNFSLFLLPLFSLRTRKRQCLERQNEQSGLSREGMKDLAPKGGSAACPREKCIRKQLCVCQERDINGFSMEHFRSRLLKAPCPPSLHSVTLHFLYNVNTA